MNSLTIHIGECARQSKLPRNTQDLPRRFWDTTTLFTCGTHACAQTPVRMYTALAKLSLHHVTAVAVQKQLLLLLLLPTPALLRAHRQRHVAVCNWRQLAPEARDDARVWRRR